MDDVDQETFRADRVTLVAFGIVVPSPWSSVVRKVAVASSSSNDGIGQLARAGLTLTSAGLLYVGGDAFLNLVSSAITAKTLYLGRGDLMGVQRTSITKIRCNSRPVRLIWQGRGKSGMRLAGLNGVPA